MRTPARRQWRNPDRQRGGLAPPVSQRKQMAKNVTVEVVREFMAYGKMALIGDRIELSGGDAARLIAGGRAKLPVVEADAEDNQDPGAAKTTRRGK